MGYCAHMKRRIWALGVISATVWSTAACGATGATSGAAESAWPRELVSGQGTGPALYLGPESAAPAVGYVSPGVVFRVAGPPEGDRLPVRIAGPLKVRAWITLTRVAALAQRRGRVRGAPAYLGPNDQVMVLGESDGGRLRVAVRPWLGRPPQESLGPFIGTFPARGLGATEVDPATVQAPPPGEPHRLPEGAVVPVFDRPGGREVTSLPSTTPALIVVVLRRRGDWAQIRAGLGPYVMGWVQSPLVPTAESPAIGGLLGAAVHQGPLPERIAAESSRPLLRVESGARVRFRGRTVAIFGQQGFAREMRRYPNGEVDVFAAVNDQLAVRGMVRAQSVSAMEEPAPAAGTPAAAGTPPATAPAGAAPTTPAADNPPPVQPEPMHEE